MAWDLNAQLAHVSGQQEICNEGPEGFDDANVAFVVAQIAGLHPDASPGGNGGLEFVEDLCPDLNMAFKLSQRLVFFFTVLWG